MLAIGRAWAEDPSGSARDELAGVLKLLYPHDVPHSVFTDIADSMQSAATDNSQLQESLDTALQSLDQSTVGGFLAADGETQLAALQGNGQVAWFLAIQGQALAMVYNHPVIWKHIGYPGSSVEYGGYKDRGFNDIDWLPSDN